MSVVQLSEREFQDAAITPVFRYENIENLAKSESAGYPIMEMLELCELRIAGRDGCVHVARASETAEQKGLKRISYAEKFSDAYNAFKNGNAQMAVGTPLEVLQSFGVTPAQISLLRARKVYTVEALQDLEGSNLKSLGMEANDLKQAVKRYSLDRVDKSKQMDEIERLREELAAFKSGVAPVVASEGRGGITQGSDPYPDLTDAELKDKIALAVGTRPQGNPKRETLVSIAKEAGV